jgi:hypothetical protein
MRIPDFTAERALSPRSRRFTARTRRRAAGVMPAIPFCGNCDEILDRCSQNGFRPRAVCRACAIGDCFSGVENPPIILNPHNPAFGF